MSNHDCTGPDCTSIAHEPILEPTGWDGYGSPLWPWQTEER